MTPGRGALASGPWARTIAALAAAAIAAAGGCGCGSRTHGRTGPGEETAATARPGPSEPLPADAPALANRLARVSYALDRSIDAWLAHGDPSRGAPPSAVTLEALYQQRAYRLLARRPRLAAQTLHDLPPRLRPVARDITTALRDLMRLTPAARPPRFRTGAPQTAGRLLADYRLAARRYRVDWHVLAAINFVETAFGRIKSSSASGAQGPMQFLPRTWRLYGSGGDVRDPHDAIPGAANYLRHWGAPANYRKALFAYNPSPLYVDAVLRYARQMARDRRAYFAFYSWQVFIRTSSGERRLTGP